jgi:hypothetical protein
LSVNFIYGPLNGYGSVRNSVRAASARYNPALPMATSCPTVFLDEETAPDFPPHRRVVDSLANLIASTRGGRVLSLVGPFGSGKTTILRRLQAKFDAERPQQSHLFLFDAWAHRGEVLRRAFIVKLTDFLADRGLLTADDRKLVEQQVTRSPDVASSTTKPKYALIAGLFAVLGMLISPTLALLNKSGEPFSVNLYAAFALFIGLFAGATFLGRTVSVTETRRASDLTSLEFQNAFTTAINRAFLNRDEAKIVIAFDDLDRIPVNDVADVITALRIFLASQDQLVDFQRLWFLVPFDRDAMKKTLGEQALEKLFALRMDVPPPNLPTNLRTFRTRFLQAFPQHTALEAQEVHAVFGTAETFRALNTFINRVAVLHASWCGRIPLTDLALYVLSEDATSSARPGGTADHETWRRNVAAIEHNVPLEEVAYVVHSEAFDPAFKDGDAAPLRAIAREVGFAQTVYRIVWSLSRPEELSSAVLALSGLDADAELDPAWDQLLVRAKGAEDWPFDEDLRGLALLLLKAPPDDRRIMTRTALRSLVKGLGKREEPQAERWLVNYTALLQALGEEIPLAELKPIGGSPHFRFQVLRFITSGRLDYPATPPIEVGDKDALQNLAVEIAASDTFDSDRTTLELLFEIGREWDWSAALKLADERIKAASVVEAGHPAIGHLMDLVAVLESFGRVEATQWLDAYAREGGFLYYLIHAWGAQTTTPAMVLALFAMRSDREIGRIVKVPTATEVLRQNADAVMEFLKQPSTNRELLDEVELILRGRGLTDAWARLETTSIQLRWRIELESIVHPTAE